MIYISKELYLYISYVMKKKEDKNKLKKQQPENSMYKMYKHVGIWSIKRGRENNSLLKVSQSTRAHFEPTVHGQKLWQ